MAPLTITPTEARRLAIEVQHLGAGRVSATAAGLLTLARDLGALQLDSADPVAPSHLLIAFSRLGMYDRRLFDRLLYQDRTLFEYFAHATSVVPTADFPIHRTLMRTWATGDSAWDRRVRIWLEANEPLRQAILARLAAEGPLRTGQFEFVPGPRWQTTAWPITRNVERMLEFLWIMGRILPTGRWRTQRIWQLTERWLPDAVAGPQPPAAETMRAAVERSLRALGIATARQVDAHFTRFRYQDVPAVLCALAADDRAQRALVASPEGGRPVWPGGWWIHVDRLPLLERIRDAGDGWVGRTTLLSPLDNLIADRPRTDLLFGFAFRQQPALPRARRAEAMSVMPLLHGDRLIGRVAARFDRVPDRTLTIRAVRPQPNVPRTAAMARVWRIAMDELALFLGAERVVVQGPLPDRWRRTMAGQAR